MALQKQFIKPNGIETNYHRISDVHLFISDGTQERENNFINISLTSYLNEQKRDEGYAIETHHYYFSIANNEDTSIGIRELAYNKIKTLPEWEGAVNC